MPREYGERLIEAIEQIGHTKHFALDDRSHIGDTVSLSVPEDSLDNQGPANEMQSPVLSFDPATPEDLLDGVISYLPSSDVTLERSNKNKGVFYLSQDQRLRGLGAKAIFPHTGSFIEPLNFQRSVLWLDLSRTDATIQSMPHLPFVMVGHRTGGRFSGDQVLAVPLMMSAGGQEINPAWPQGQCEFTEDQKGFGPRIYQGGEKKGKSRLDLAERGIAQTLDVVDSLLTGAINTVFGGAGSAEQSRDSKSGGKKALEVARFRFPLNMVYQFNMPKKGYEIFSEGQSSALSGYSEDEIETIYDPNSNQVVIDERSPRSIHNGGIRTGLFKRGSAKNMQVSLVNPEQIVFRDREIDDFAVMEHLARLAVNLGVADRIKTATQSS